MTSELKAHPAAELFPLMEGEDFAGLMADIKAHGQRDPIVVHEHQILDGRNRYRACQELRIKAKLAEWDEEGDAVEYVVSKNLHRRHLSDSQRALVSAKLKTWSLGENQHSGEGLRNCRPYTGPEAAKLLNVGTTTFYEAKKVLAEGTPEEIRAIESGEMSVHSVAEQIKRGSTPDQRKKSRDKSLSSTGRNPERIQRAQLNAEVWGRIRDALIHLTSLPLVTDVVAIAQAHDRTGLVDQRIEQSLKWLKDFSHEWNHRDQVEAEDRAARGRNADAGVGDRAA